MIHDIEDTVYKMGQDKVESWEVEKFLKSNRCWDEESAYEMGRVYLRGLHGEPRYLEDDE